MLRRSVGVCDRGCKVSACAQNIGRHRRPLAQRQRRVCAAQNVIGSVRDAVRGGENNICSRQADRRNSRLRHCRNYQKWPRRRGSKRARVERETGLGINGREKNSDFTAGLRVADKSCRQRERKKQRRARRGVGEGAEASVRVVVEQGRFVVVGYAIGRRNHRRAGAFGPGVIGDPADLKRAFALVKNGVVRRPGFRDLQLRAADDPVVRAEQRIETRHHRGGVEADEGVRNPVGCARGGVGRGCAGNRQCARTSVIRRWCVGADEGVGVHTVGEKCGAG